MLLRKIFLSPRSFAIWFSGCEKIMLNTCLMRIQLQSNFYGWRNGPRARKCYMYASYATYIDWVYINV